MAGKWTKEEEETLQRSYYNLSKDKLLNLFPNRTWKALNQKINKLNFGQENKRRKHKYYWNLNYFEKINTKEKAYWYGLLMADGNIKDTSLRLDLVKEGFQHVEKFCQAIQYTGPIVKYYSKSNFSSHLPHYKIELCSKVFTQHLKNIGVVPNKTFIVQFPNWLNKDLKPHFIRGWWDGDGWITGKKYPVFAGCGANKEFLHTIVQHINSELNVKQPTIHRCSNPRCYQFQFNGKNALKIRDWLYQDATVWMEYKKEKFYNFA